MHNYIIPNIYKNKTRIGNWSEEVELQDTKQRDYDQSQNNQDLKTVQKQQQNLKAHQAVQFRKNPSYFKFIKKASQTFSKDGFLHFGDRLMFFNKQTSGFLGCDVWDRIQGLEQNYAVTSVPNLGPTSRSVFLIERAEKDLHNDNFLHYGQQFQIIVNPRMFHQKLWLSSYAVTPQKCAQISRFQEVSLASKDSFNSVWVIEHADPKIRFEMNGQKVQANAPLLIKHSLTSQWLASDIIAYKNDFGSEFQVFCHSYQVFNKTQNLIAQKTGRTTIDIPLRNQEEQNIWSVVSAGHPSYEFDESALDRPDSAVSLVNQIKNVLGQKGSTSLKNLVKAFNEMDINQDGTLDPDDFKWGLRNQGLNFSNDEIKLLISHFDVNKNNKIELGEFINTIRIPLNEGRVKLIFKAYDHVNAQLGGNVTLQGLVILYDAKNHPQVKNGKQAERDVFRDFAESWDKSNPDKRISEEEFAEYYRDVSGIIERDDLFENLLRSIWRF